MDGEMEAMRLMRKQVPALQQYWHECGEDAASWKGVTTNSDGRIYELHLERCDSLSSLPESIMQLTALTTLHLELCDSLSSLPESIGQLTALTTLHLERCASLSSLPESIGSSALPRSISGGAVRCRRCPS